MQCVRVVQFIILKAGFTNDRTEVGAIIRNAEYYKYIVYDLARTEFRVCFPLHR